MMPGYSGGVGAAWLEQGGVYVVANIRGGGEFGPAWHQAALKANRHKAYEDFVAVAEDLVARKVTSTPHLGIKGGSNGGLLMGNMLTMRPDLFGAVVCQVPLLDMQRYHKLLAGASWMAEYGNPDNPKEWAFIQTFSPYHNLKDGVKYPPTLFTTSTRDDRVHPGHARKMVARMLDDEARRPLLREHRGRPRRRGRQQAVGLHERAGLHVPVEEAEVIRERPYPESASRARSQDPQSQSLDPPGRRSGRPLGGPPRRPTAKPPGRPPRAPPSPGS